MTVMNISSDETYQLLLYIQSDQNIEQKTDSKVKIQCSPQVTKNIIFEHNALSEFSRKIEQNHPNKSDKNQTIVPIANLSVRFNNTDNQTDMFTSHIDLLKGRIPYLKIINGSIKLGDDVTLIIRSKKHGIYETIDCLVDDHLTFTPFFPFLSDS